MLPSDNALRNAYFTKNILEKIKMVIFLTVFSLSNTLVGTYGPDVQRKGAAKHTK